MIDSHCHRDKQSERKRERERDRDRQTDRHTQRASACPCGMAIVLSCLTVIMVDIDA